ncbi:hypothetical protein ABIC11_000402 [Pseudomonas oryzihabitans]|uniref:Uncharacterized protein n=1 Tax=Pseudomonas flavocrustae TaxID=2991719 RepID=A0ABT6IDG2_9PSED|nr:hypothetical protein [Pseudomonas sp. CBMAI 2609]MDH4762059.1 hypothetical protein [Pseudomonas sp. CBMAI 2609]
MTTVDLQLPEELAGFDDPSARAPGVGFDLEGNLAQIALGQSGDRPIQEDLAALGLYSPEAMPAFQLVQRSVDLRQQSSGGLEYIAIHLFRPQFSAQAHRNPSLSADE